MVIRELHRGRAVNALSRRIVGAHTTMKALLIFLLGAVVGAFGYHLYRERDPRIIATANGAAADTRDALHNTGDAIGDKLRDWKLTPDDLRSDLSHGGEIIRSNAKKAGSEFDDARILTVLKAKYVLDRDLSARSINVNVERGRVVLEGNVATTALLGRAIAIALDTDGVQSVASRLSVATP